MSIVVNRDGGWFAIAGIEALVWAQIDPFGWDPDTALLTDEDWSLVGEG